MAQQLGNEIDIVAMVGMLNQFGGRKPIGHELRVPDNVRVYFGNGGPAFIEWHTDDANANLLFIQLPTGGAVDVPVIVVGDPTANKDFAQFNGQTQPGFFIADDDADSYVGFDFSADDTPRVRVVGSASTADLGIPRSKLSGSLNADGNGLINIAKLQLQAATALTLAANTTGTLTVTQSYHKIRGSGTLAGTVTSIVGGNAGDILILELDSVNAGDITIIDGGTLNLGASRVLSSSSDKLVLVNVNGANWGELAYSDNG